MSPAVIARLILAPLVVALLTAVELSALGVLATAAGAYIAFVVAEAAVVFWGRYQLRLARRDLATRRRLLERQRSHAAYDHDDGR